MILKVVPKDALYTYEGATFFDLGPASNGLTTGAHYFDTSPSTDRDYSQTLGLSMDSISVIGCEEAPPNTGEQGQWRVIYAHWLVPGQGTYSVVTDGVMYLMSDSGTTIEKIR